MKPLSIAGWILGATVAMGCKSDPISPRPDALVSVRAQRDGVPGREVPDDPAECFTMRTVEAPDVLRVDGGVAYYARLDTGLSIFDVADLDAPRLVASSPFVGTPVGVFLHGSIAYVVFVDWGAPTPRSVVRALDVGDPATPVMLGEVELPGLARDARLAGGVVYVLTDDAPAGGDAKVALSSFAVRKGVLRKIDEAALLGGPGTLAMSPRGAAVLRAETTGGSILATRVDFAPTGELSARGTLRLPGALPIGEPSERGRVELDEDLVLVGLTCMRAGCPPSSPSILVTADLADPDHPRVLARSTLEDAPGRPPARSVAHVFLYATAMPHEPEPTTQVVALRLTAAGVPFESGRITVRGSITTIVPRSVDHAVLIGSTGPHRRAQIVLHDLSIQDDGSLRSSGSVALGRDWTWTLAHDTDRAVSLDPTHRFFALPFTAFTEAERRYETGVEVVELGSGGRPVARPFSSNASIERLVFLRGRLVGFGAEGVEVIPYVDAAQSSSSEGSVLPIR